MEDQAVITLLRDYNCLMGNVMSGFVATLIEAGVDDAVILRAFSRVDLLNEQTLHNPKLREAARYMMEQNHARILETSERAGGPMDGDDPDAPAPDQG